ncbi:UDP-N-acetylmuramate dehydrogenase [Gangjinia marincola]|uniref:UDP-N-acetylenolpyruvoylglucosamine reductase n=1 Tax=Gangjinia marincola TaxID=578463 RepID=A0ABN1MJ35_9FLAO
MQKEFNRSLKEFNTFGIDVKAKEYISVSTADQLIKVLDTHRPEEIFLLGGGSNMLLTNDVYKTVVHLNLKGKKVVERNDNKVIIECLAGENWHEFVLWSIDHDYGGLENLSLIPGNVGTSPIQNIGAYGVELKDVFHACEAVEIASGEIRKFSKEECEFDYRHSIFKSDLKGKFIITKVFFRLTEKNHVLNTSYGVIEDTLTKKGVVNPTIKDVSNAVIQIRQSKLPDPKHLGNSGSFFKNPVIPKETFEQLKKKHPQMPMYAVSKTMVKVPAGWLVDQCGLKGFRDGEAGVHKHQALVLVNYGNATGEDVLSLAKMVQQTVMDKFEISLEAEVNIIA